MARKRRLFYDEKKTYLFSFGLLALLLASFLLPTESGRIAGASLTLLAALLATFLIKKRTAGSINAKTVLLVMTVMGLLFITLYYMTGFAFGFYKALVRFSVPTFFRYILPIAVTVVASEIVRSILLSQKRRGVALLSYLICFTAEVLVTAGIRSVHTANQLVDVLGYSVLPAVTANVLYHYISERYGKYPNISYRLIVTLFPYIIPVTSQLSDAIYSFARLAVPLLIYAFLELLYGKKKRVTGTRKKRIAVFLPILLSATLMLSFITLISGQTRYGLIVIATESMTGEINKGDAVIYVKYDDQPIEVGQVVIYEKNKSVIVHRVVDIEIIDGVARYYTKGDANEDMDAGYITATDIVGITDFKIPYIGMPTLWLGDMFS